jgi:hypothetical protein
MDQQSPVITGLRKQYPGYEDIPDDEFVSSVHEAHYKDLSEEDYLQSLDDAYGGPKTIKKSDSILTKAAKGTGTFVTGLPGAIKSQVLSGAHTSEALAQAQASGTQEYNFPTVAEMAKRGYSYPVIQNLLQQQMKTYQGQAAEEASASTAAKQYGGEAAGTVASALTTEALPALKLLKAAKPLLKAAVTGAVGVGTYMGAQKAGEGEPLGEVAKATGTGALTGAILGPIIGRAGEAAGAVLSIPKNIVTGYNDASQRLAKQAEVAMQTAARSIGVKWADKFNVANLHMFTDIFGDLTSGKMSASDAAAHLFQKLLGRDPAESPEAVAKVAQKIGRWQLAQPSRAGTTYLPQPEVPANPVGVEPTALPVAQTPEPNVVNPPGPPAPEPLPVEPVPGLTGSTPGTQGVTTPELPPEGFVPGQTAAPAFNAPPQLNPAQGIEPPQTPTSEPNPINLGQPTVTPRVGLPNEMDIQSPLAPSLTGPPAYLATPSDVAGIARLDLPATVSKDATQGTKLKLTPLWEELEAPARPPGPGGWHQQVHQWADANIAAAESRLKDRGTMNTMKAFVHPADVADAMIIGANYMLKGAVNFTDWSARMVEEFGEQVRPHLQRLYADSKAAFEARRPMGNDEVRRVSEQYNRTIGLGPGKIGSYQPVSKAIGQAIAKEYDALPTSAKPGTPEFNKARQSYNALKMEVEQQYQSMLKSGLKVEVVDQEPYASSADMMKDLRENWRLKVLMTGENQAHPFLDAETNNKLRAVHDFFGHAKEGYEFGPRGEDNAWRAHASMFSNDAIPALTTETRGQNSWVNFTEGHADLPAGKRPFAEQKFGLLPEWTYKDALEARKGQAPGLTKGTHGGIGGGNLSLEDAARAVSKGIPKATNPTTQLSRAISDATSAVPEWDKVHPESRGWYAASIDRMMQQAQQEFPSLQGNEGAQKLFKLVVATTSQASKPPLNLANASSLWDGYTKNGAFPLLGRMGQEYGMYGRTVIPKLNTLLDRSDNDPAKAIDHLMTQDGKGNYEVVKMFGPKIGRFFLNLMGVHDEVTVDRWMIRWFNRTNGNMFRNGVIDDSPTEGERKLVTSAVQHVADQMKMRPDEVQAILWDREKSMWRNAGLRDPGDLDFAQSAEVLYKNRNATLGNVSANLADATIRPVDAKTFHDAVTTAAATHPKAEGSLTVHPLEKYADKNTENFLSADGKTGFSLFKDPDGGKELVSLFNIGEKGMGKVAMDMGVRRGATRLDAIEPLAKHYEKSGFHVVKKESNWTPGQPDVVYMEHKSAPIHSQLDLPLR